MLTQKFVQETFDYDPEGGLIWKAQVSNSVRAGQKAGTVASGGYCRVSIAGHMYALHHVVYLWHHGNSFKEIDHIDRDPGNNRIENLRPATRHQNQRNTRKQAGTSSRFKGVAWVTQAGKWKAQIRVDGKLQHLGYFIGNPEGEADAATAYNFAACRYFGEFAAINEAV